MPRIARTPRGSDVGACVKPPRKIPATNEIKMFFHCAHCLKDKPIGISPRAWVSLEAGWTELGLQVWCKRCEMNIIHVDFEGQKHHANDHGRESSEIIEFSGKTRQ
jgi:hypothetical protein